MTLRPAVVLVLAVTLAACGFQLRGTFDIDDALQPVRVEASGDFGDALERGLRAGGVELTRDRDRAATTLRVHDTERDRRVLALRADGRVDEYELVFRVDWTLTEGGRDGEARTLIERTRYSGQRSYIFDPGSRLAADDEERVLIELLHEELADRILRRLQAWSPGD